MRSAGRMLIAALCWLIPAVSMAQTVSPRAAVSDVGAAIRDRYFDVARGAEIAADLDADAARGEFDALTDARNLAQGLTERLRPLDRHFQVQWSRLPPAGTTPPQTSGPINRLPPSDIARRSNYGFRRAEVLPGNIGYIRLSGFSAIDPSDPRSPAREAADAALRMVTGADAVIIDLRDNGGGDPSMVGYLASAFLEPGFDAYNRFRTRDGELLERPATRHAEPRPGTPLFILVSGRSASAAEGFSYTLQAAGRATIVGEVTAGAANPGHPVDVGQGLSVFVPIGTPVNPITGGNWEAAGVRPDVEVVSSEALEEGHRRALEAAVATFGDRLGSAEARWVLESLSAGPVTAPVGDYAGGYGSAHVTSAGNVLTFQELRRPLRTFRALSPDLFSDTEDPARRLRFERNGAGAVVALELLNAYGEVSRRRRD